MLRFHDFIYSNEDPLNPPDVVIYNDINNMGVELFENVCKTMFCKSQFISYEDAMNSHLSNLKIEDNGQLLLLINNEDQIIKFNTELGANPKNIKIYYTHVVRSKKDYLKGNIAIVPFIVYGYNDYFISLTGDADANYYYGREYTILSVVKKIYEVYIIINN